MLSENLGYFSRNSRFRKIVNCILAVSVWGAVLITHAPQVTAGNILPKEMASFIGTHNTERVGYWLSGAGDVNQDGYADFIIANYHSQTPGTDAGAVYLILGRASENWRRDVSLTQADARFIGDASYAAFGYNASGGGDVNGDGFDDIVIGAPAGNSSGGARPGSAYLIFGKKNPDWGYNFKPAVSGNVIFDGEYNYDQAGKAVSINGDINGDGLADILIAAPYYDQRITDGGKIYLILGKTSGWSSRIKLSSSDASFVSRYRGDNAGYMVAWAGDVNHDGYDDFLIGAVGRGNVYLVLGRPNPSWGQNFELSLVNVKFTPESYSDNTGWIVAGVGDVNHDNFDDFIITSTNNSQIGLESGKVYLILGRAVWENPFTLSSADASYLGEATFDNAGWGAAGVGDLNGDNYDDFMIGAWQNDQSFVDAGKAYIIYGKATGWQKDVRLGTIPDYLLGGATVDYLGFAVAGVGDMNHDGLSDFIVSAAFHNQTYTMGGKVYLYYAQRPQYPISGAVRYFDNQLPVPDVGLNLTGTTEASTVSNAQGAYRLLVPNGQDITLTPAKTKGSAQNSLTILSYDAALVARHVLGIAPLNAEQQLAADVDQNGTISVYDAALIARYVVGLPELPNSFVAAWKFNPVSHHFLALNDSLQNQDFSGLIIGNVHGGWSPTSNFARFKNNTPSVLNTFPNRLAASQYFTWPVSIEENALLAFDLEFTFDPNAFEFIQIRPNSKLKNFNLNYLASEGRFTLSLYGSEAIAAPVPLFELDFKTNSQTSNPTLVHLNRLVINDQWSAPGSLEIGLNSGASSSPVFTLEPNYPNPFNPRTVIAYQLAQSGMVNLVIVNVRGEQVRTLVNATQPAGKHTLVWDGKDQVGAEVAAGIYFCRLVQGNAQRVQRMLKLL
ncbi:T9SS type A sorting domain-containing protein [candidate division KSB1 bacterium]|nr:T9SS type A sorting domain-containing protein [candidate division KSB1 bacterium]